MDIWHGLGIICVLYGCVYFLNTFFKTCAHYPYYQFLKGTGLEIQFLQIRWRTTFFNRCLIRWGNGYTKFFNAWFTVGLYITLILLPISIVLLGVAVVQDFFPRSQGGESVIEPLIVGVNLPASEIGFYGLSIILSTVIHELGHALAAVKEDVHVVNVGFNVIFILPIAYVNLSSEKLLSLNPWRQLKILCAGIWHNVILAVFVYLLYIIMPYVFSSVYNLDTGVFVKDIQHKSPLLGSKGLVVADVINGINDCYIDNEDDWHRCLHKFKSYKPGICATTDTVHELDESVLLKQLPSGIYDCCASGKSGNLCFEFLDNSDGVLEIPPHVCLPARAIIETSPQFCDAGYHCPSSYHCLRPFLDNNTNLLVINRIASKNIIYIGHANDIFYTVKISPFVPNYIFSSTIVPDTIMKLLAYLVVFNVSLALLNVIPCMCMDGQHITNSVFHILFMRRFGSTQTINMMSLAASLFGTFLLVCHCLYSIWLKVL